MVWDTLFWRQKWGGFPLLALFALALYAQNSEQTMRGGNGVTLPPPPPTPAHSVKDEYQGMQIEDPYRWLEDAKGPGTRAWIDEQNKYTQQYFDQLKNHPWRKAIGWCWCRTGLLSLWIRMGSYSASSGFTNWYGRQGPPLRWPAPRRASGRRTTSA